MENKIKNIKQNEKRSRELLNERDLLFTELGNLLVENKISFPDDENTGRLINELKNEIKNINSENERINQYKKRIEAIVLEEKTALKKIKDIKADNEKHYIGIGETVYTIYLERPGELFELHDYMKELIDLNEKVDEIEGKIENRERKKDNEGFLGKLLITGTGTVLESRKKVLETRFLTLYKAAGKKLCDDKYFETVSDKELKGIFSAYEANLKVIEDFEIKLDTLKAEKANYQTEIDEKEKKLKTEYSKKIEEAVEDKKAELDGIMLSAGKSFYSVLSGEEDSVEIDNSEITVCLKKIGENEKLREELAQENEKLNREITIEKKQAEIEKLKESVHSRQDKIKSVKKEIDKMNRAAKRLEKEIEELMQK